jgi:hypothetical protein
MFAHPGCYARVLNDCSSKLSREHYVSRTVLDLLGDEHRITNASWLLPGQQSKPLATSALGSRVLCEKHNHALSRLDSQALTFFDALLWGSLIGPRNSLIVASRLMRTYLSCGS